MMKIIKCVLVGDNDVGKTNLIYYFLKDHNPLTCFNKYDIDVAIGDKKVLFSLCDTAGQSHDDLRPVSYPKTHVLLVCFSLSSPASYESVRAKWYPEVSLHCPHSPIILVGTKLNLRDDNDTIDDLKKENLAPITTVQGESLAKEINAVKYLECSGLSPMDADAVFTQAFLEALSPYNRSYITSILKGTISQDLLVTDANVSGRTAADGVSAVRGLSACVKSFRVTHDPNTEALDAGQQTTAWEPATQKSSRSQSLSPLIVDRPLSSDDAYKVTSPQGLCLVINIGKYETGVELTDRPGSHLDVERVRSLFERLNFQVQVKENLKCQEILKFLCDLVFSRDLEQHGCFVCFIMAHGKSGSIFASDGEELEIRTIADKFRANHCSGLRNKPKLLFIQACRGIQGDVERGMAIDSQGSAALNLHCPQDSDFLLCYANTDGKVAFRDESSGSPFVQTLCDVIEERHTDEHITDMITKVTGRLKATPIKSGQESYYIVPQLVSQLSKKCFLNPSLAGT